MSIIIDLIVIAIVALTGLLSAKRGFVRCVIELAGFIAAVYITFALSAPLANATYDRFVEPTVVSSVTSASNDTADDVVEGVWNALPGFIKSHADTIGLSRENLNDKIAGNIENGAQAAVESASQAVIKPVVTGILGLLYSLIIMIILMIAVKFLAKFLNKLFSFSLIGKVNHALGFIVGIFKGIIIAFVFCIAVSLIVSFTTNGILIFTKENIDGTAIFSYIVSFSPFK